MDTQQITTRVAAAHALSAAHPVIGIGGPIAAPFDAIVRELVVMRIILDGSIYRPGDLEQAVDAYASRYEVRSHA